MNKRFSHIGLSIAIALYFLFLSVPASAQICTGSLGDAVVNVTFGSGANPGPALAASTTNYGFTSGSCPGDGFYTVVNSTAGCFGSTWHSIPEDHTPGDVNGYMMLVNASITPGDFYVDTVRGLCAGTTYEFGAWITNVIVPSSCGGASTEPQLTFKIETPAGVQIGGSYNTGNIAATGTAVWRQYGFFFTTLASSTDVVIRITNNAPGGCGNDLALDDITFRPCGPTVTAGFANVATPSLDLCIGNTASTTLSATVSSGYTAPAYQWQLYNGTAWVDIAGATALTYIRTATGAAGTYKYRLTVAESTNIGISNCRVASNEAVVTVHALPVATAANDGPVCVGKTLTLSATGGSTYQWTGPGGFTAATSSPQLVAGNTSAGLYAVTVTDAFNCTAAASTTVATFPQPVAVVSGTQSICSGDSVSLQASGGAVYSWLPVAGLSDAGISNPVARPDSTTRYVVTVAGNNTCFDTASILVTVNISPVISAGADKSLIKGQSVVLDGSILAGAANVSFSWLPADFLSSPFLLQPVAKPLVTTDYILKASSTIGCGTASDTMTVKVYNDLYIPNAFSPNGLGGNNTWHIDALSAYPKAVLTIYNRFGQKIFESSGNARDWDGKYNNVEQPTGAYPYVIDLRNGRPVVKGMVLILR